MTVIDRPRATPRQHLPAVDRALADLNELAGLVEGLALLRDPASHRPWREPTLTPDARAELDADAREERHERNGIAPGEHPDAARADVLDALAAVLDQAADLAHHLSRAARCPILRPPAADADPRPYLRHAANCLPVAVAAWTNGAEIAYWAADQAHAMLAATTQALSLVIDGQRLKVICPWCHGGITGAYTWRVRTLPGDQTCVVCEGDQACEPPSKDVGTWWRGRPAWSMNEWEWLAQRIHTKTPR